MCRIQHNFDIALDLEWRLMFKGSLDIIMPDIPIQSLQKVELPSPSKYDE